MWEGGRAIGRKESYHGDNEYFRRNHLTILLYHGNIPNDHHIALNSFLLAMFKNWRCCDESSTNEGTDQSRKSHLDRRGCARLKVLRGIDDRLLLHNRKEREE